MHRPVGPRRRCQRPRRCPLLADPTRQARLIEVQALDTRLDQIEHARDTLAQHKQLAELTTRSDTLDTDLALARTALSDVEREVAKAEADVQLVRDRAARDQARLDAGTGTAKDLQALQHELLSLARRQGELEDLELDVMERAETLEARVGELARERGDLDGRIVEVTASRDAAVATFGQEEATIREARARLVPEVGEDLLALYAKIRSSAGGVGAAELRQRRCTGCQLELNQVDLARIKAAPPDEVLRCEECRRVLVRTAESWL